MTFRSRDIFAIDVFYITFFTMSIIVADQLIQIGTSLFLKSVYNYTCILVKTMIYFVSIKAKESTGRISRLLFCCIRSANGGISLKPVIGLIPLYDDDKESLDLSQAYQWCDGILFTGGHDVSPSVYGEPQKESCGRTCPARDQMEGYLLDKCLQDHKPLLGICRGIQFINARLGGTLYQDLPSEYESGVEHHMTPPYDRTAHNVEVLKGTKLAGIIGEGIHGVNSYHHQAIKALSPLVNVMAYSEDGLVEAIEVKDQEFAVAIQWHPEFSYKSDPDSIKLVQAFIDACT